MFSNARSEDLPLDQFFPLRAAVVTLRFLAPAHMPLFHQPVLTAFLRSLLGGSEDYDLLLTVDTPESGRTRYRPGDRYTFTLFSLPGGDIWLQTALERLSELPDAAKLTDPRLSFRNNLAFCEARDLFWGHDIRSVDNLYVYTADDLIQETEQWRRIPDERQLFFPLDDNYFSRF